MTPMRTKRNPEKNGARDRAADQVLAERLLRQFGRARGGAADWDEAGDKKRGRFLREARELREFLREQRELGVVEEW